MIGELFAELAVGEWNNSPRGWKGRDPASKSLVALDKG